MRNIDNVLGLKEGKKRRERKKEKRRKENNERKKKKKKARRTNRKRNLRGIRGLGYKVNLHDYTTHLASASPSHVPVIHCVLHRATPNAATPDEHKQTGRWGSEISFFASTPLEPCSPRSSPSRSSMQWSRITADSRASALNRFRLPSKKPSLGNPKRTPTMAGTAVWVPRSGGQMSVSSSPLSSRSPPLF